MYLIHPSISVKVEKTLVTVRHSGVALYDKYWGSVTVKQQVESLVSILASSCLLSTWVALSEQEPFMLLAL